MKTFSADIQDLQDATSYELDALEFIRTTVFHQSEASRGVIYVTVGNFTPDGRQCVGAQAVGSLSNTSDGAGLAAISRLRPLAFSAAFKLQDMIAEWILKANGPCGYHFKAKIGRYDSLIATGEFVEPKLFTKWPALSIAFWSSYRYFLRYRHTVIHAGGVVLRVDGTLEITRNSDTLVLTSDHQASYVRAMCLLAKCLTSQTSPAPMERQLIENDFAALAFAHGQRSLAPRPVLLVALQVDVPRAARRVGSTIELGADTALHQCCRLNSADSAV